MKKTGPKRTTPQPEVIYVVMQRSLDGRERPVDCQSTRSVGRNRLRSWKSAARRSHSPNTYRIGEFIERKRSGRA